LQSYVDEGFLTYKNVPRPHAQIEVYHYCIRDHRAKHNWIAFFDADEFLIIRDGYGLPVLYNPQENCCRIGSGDSTLKKTGLWSCAHAAQQS
jgi:hypothetical protein